MTTSELFREFLREFVNTPRSKEPITIPELIKLYNNKYPKNKLSLTEMISGLTQGTKPVVNIKTLDVDLEGIKKLAENLARKKNPNFNKLKRDKQIEIYRTMVAQLGTRLNKAKLFKDANRLKAFKHHQQNVHQKNFMKVF